MPAIQQLQVTLITNFPIDQGLVNDPFRDDNQNQLQLWKNQDNRQWIWLDPDTSDLVYLQYWDMTSKKNLVLWFPHGLEASGVSSYDFQIFGC